MHILTFDIEDWFHILDNTETQTEADWLRYPSRIEQSVDKILSLLSETDTKATFFVLGWVTRKHPKIIRKIHQLGYHIATHSDMHTIAYEQDRQTFRADLDRSVKSIEDITGKKVNAYRAPGFSFKEQNKWAFDLLIEAGIEIDCSIFPAKRAHGGFEEFGLAEPCWVQTEGRKIKEFPMNLKNFAGTKFIFSGGGYFRFFPYNVLQKWMDTKYLMTYFHPRDFDPGQPIIPGLSPWRRFKSYYGLRNTYEKLAMILKEYEFIDLNDADKIVNWAAAPVKLL